LAFTGLLLLQAAQIGQENVASMTNISHLWWWKYMTILQRRFNIKVALFMDSQAEQFTMGTIIIITCGFIVSN